jgi:hypothetical protein
LLVLLSKAVAENPFAYLHTHVGPKRGDGKDLHLVSSADAVSICFEQGCRRHPKSEARGLASREHSQSFMAHCKPSKAELSCEIRMELECCRCEDLSARDARHCWIFPDLMMQLEGVSRTGQIFRPPSF